MATSSAVPSSSPTSPSSPTRSAFLFGSLVGVCAGGALAFFAGRMSALPDAPGPDARKAPRARVAALAPAAAPSGSADAVIPPGLKLNSFPEVSFAQQGEDLIIKQIFGELGVANATYIDIGAHDPIRGNNTYLFYALGSHGVLVEPNPAYAAKLRAARPRDRVLEEGIGTQNEAAADYYEFGEDGQENTFSKEQADKLVKLGMKIERVVKMPLADINEVLAANFGKTAPSLLSVDTEGLDLAILRTIDFKRFRPIVICAETLEVGSNRALDEIGALLRTKGYVPRGGTFVNTIFVAEEALTPATDGDGGSLRRQ